MNQHVAIYVGSFDPITHGHLDVLQRSRRLFDRIILGIGHNPDKPAVFSPAERLEMVSMLVDELMLKNPEGAPVTVQPYPGLTVDFAKEVGAAAIIRGIRNITDLAMECQLAIINRQVADVETVFIITAEAYAFTSSNLIRQMAALGGDLDRLSAWVPPVVIDRMKEKANSPGNPLRGLAEDKHIE